MGAVYAAVDEVLERPVAVKLIRDDLVGSPRSYSSLPAGSAHGRGLCPSARRPRLRFRARPRFSGLSWSWNCSKGETLRQRLASGAPLERARCASNPARRCALRSAPRTCQGLVHRDLKPENIFLQRHASGVVPKVLDFGLAKAFGAQWPLDHSTASGPSAGLLVGTLEYMAPEQAAGDDVKPGVGHLGRLGVITYEMLTGTSPLPTQRSHSVWTMTP